MIIWGIFSQVFLSLLAVMGLVFSVRAVLDAYLTPSAVSAAITIRTKKDADDLDILLCEASKQIRRRGSFVAVLTFPHLMHGEIGDSRGLYPAYQAVMEAYGAKLYIILENDQPPSA